MIPSSSHTPIPTQSDFELAYDPYIDSISKKDTAILSLELYNALVSVEVVYRKSNEVYFKDIEDIYQILEFYSMIEKNSQDVWSSEACTEFHANTNQNGVPNLSVNNKSNGFFVTTVTPTVENISGAKVDEEVSSIIFESSDNNDISENIQKFANEWFGDEKFAYDLKNQKGNVKNNDFDAIREEQNRINDILGVDNKGMQKKSGNLVINCLKNKGTGDKNKNRNFYANEMDYSSNKDDPIEANVFKNSDRKKSKYW